MKKTNNSIIKYWPLPLMVSLLFLTASFKSNYKSVSSSHSALCSDTIKYGHIFGTTDIDSTIAYGDIRTTFPGGIEGYNKYIVKKAEYPSIAIKYRIMGCTYVRFIIEKDGSLSNITVWRDPGTEMGDEGLRVIKASPNWIPVMKNGKPIRTKCTAPVNFNLDENNKATVTGYATSWANLLSTDY
jgi:hypothetical protein